MISWLLSLLVRLPALVGVQLMRALDSVFHLFVFFGVFLAFAHRVGWVDRLIWRIGEREATKLCNGAPVTAGSFFIDWTRALEGRLRITVHNIIIHSPERDAWQWASPLVARIGVAVVECNLITTLLNLAIRHIEIPVELYSVRLVDIQVFVERRQHIFNFYLLNPTLIIPDPKDIMGDIATSGSGKGNDTDNISCDKEKDWTASASASASAADDGATSSDNESRDDSDDDKRSTNGYDSALASQTLPLYPRRSTILNDTDDQAQAEAATEVTLATTVSSTTSIAIASPVRSNVRSRSVSPFGADAERNATVSTKRTTSPLPEQAQAQQLVQDMLQAVKSLGQAATQTGSFHDALQRHGHQWANTLRKVREPGKVLQHVAESFQSQTDSSSISSPGRSAPVLIPERKVSGLPPPVYGRVGRILIQGMRIFTRDAWETSDTNADASNSNSNNIEDSTHNGGNGWSRPITIQQVLLRASDLCPPLSMNELAQHGDPSMPAIYQPLDKLAEVLQRRVLTEMAKTNTGRLLRTAMGEFIGFMKLQTAAANSGSISSNSSLLPGDAPVQQ